MTLFSKLITQPIVENEILMSGIIGGMLCAAGMAFVFGANASTGWYFKNPTKMIMLLARQSEAADIFRLIKSIDEKAFISQGVVRGVWGEGFDAMKG